MESKRTWQVLPGNGEPEGMAVAEYLRERADEVENEKRVSAIIITRHWPHGWRLEALNLTAEETLQVLAAGYQRGLQERN